jgi:iron-sulfur cluster assembly accessory protein
VSVDEMAGTHRQPPEEHPVSADATVQTVPTEAEQTVTLTETAAEKVRSFLADQPDLDDIALRVAVQAGGCAGFRYALFFDDRQLDGDVKETQHGITIRIDRMSTPYLGGSVIDWKESLEASGFSIENPNSSGSCACGDSATF